MTFFKKNLLFWTFPVAQKCLFNACAICLQYLYLGIMYCIKIQCLIITFNIIAAKSLQKTFIVKMLYFFILSLYCPLESYDFLYEQK